MCGFVAILGRSSPAEIERMGRAVAHRGPDGRGLYRDEAFAAIHHRLAIIGPDERGRQPMTVDGVTVLFNGCIYNYPELRKELEEEGVRFFSDSDTEILPHLFRRHGPAMLSMLDGMFAIVLWDPAVQELFFARDPFGEKPLFVCAQAGRLGLASSSDAFACGDWQLTPDISAVGEALCHMRVGAPRTMYAEVRQLPPGCYAVGRPGDGLPRLHRYHHLPETAGHQELDMVEAEEETGRLLDHTFLKRTLADRSIGVFLSGGIDSSLIAESLARQLSVPLHTFSVRFADGPGDYDESPYAANVAGYIGSEHAVLEVRAEAHEALEELAAAFDLPVTNAAALPTWLMCREAKRHIDVALSGVGGDELFGGYPRYLGMLWHQRLRHLPGRNLVLGLVRLLGEGSGSRNRRGRLRRFLEQLNALPHMAYAHWTSAGMSPWSAMFRLPEPDSVINEWESAADSLGGLAGLMQIYGEVQGAMAWDLLTYLPDDLLTMGDRMSMGHALELRAPFVDVHLARQAFSLPVAMKVDGMPWREDGLKRILKRIAAGRLPPQVVNRPKQGFMAPVKHWLNGPLASRIAALCRGRPLGGLLRVDYVQQEWQRHQSGEDRSDMLWGILLLDEWMRQREWQFD